jgi:biopolymer transport protein ExbD
VRFEPRPRDDDARVLPLINVVFLLLIFFMLAGALAPADPFRVDPPLSLSEAPPPAEPLTLLIGADGELALDGERLDEAGLLDRLGELIEPGAAAPELHIKADAALEALQVVGLLEKLRATGLRHVRLLTAYDAG